MRELRALDPLLHPDYEDMLHRETQFVGRFHTLVTQSVCPPFAISLDGLWGAGKTTVMQLLKKLLEAPYLITPTSLDALGKQGVVSDVREQLRPLKYLGCQDEETLWAALTQAIGEHGFEHYKPLFFEHFKAEPYPVFWFNPWEYQEAESIVLAFLQRFAQQMFKRFDKKFVRESFKILGTVSLVGLNVALKALPQALAPVIDAVKDLDEIEKTANRLERQYEKYDDIIAAVKKEFSELIQAVSKQNKGKPVIIFFDDLDRCLPDKTIQLLEAVKNLFVVPNTEVIFICGIDTRIAKQFIKAHYKGIEENFAINYFRKIFNLTLSMPYYQRTTLRSSLSDYISRVYGWESDRARALAEMVAIWGAQAEMVSVRKYLNVLHNFYAFQQFNPGYTFNPEHDVVLFLLLVKEAWQPLFEDLVKDAMQSRTSTLSELVTALLEEDNGRETKNLRPEQRKFLHDCFISPDSPFHRIKLGDELLLQYPTLA